VDHFGVKASQGRAQVLHIASRPVTAIIIKSNRESVKIMPFEYFGDRFA
jgi:hypothetical protein